MNSGVANIPAGEEKPAIPDHTLLRDIGGGVQEGVAPTLDRFNKNAK